MTEPFVSDALLIEGSRRLARLVSMLGEEFGSLPALGEFLEVLSVAVPVGDGFASNLPVPFRLKAKVKGNRRYSYNRKSRVAELNDAAFTGASDFLSFLGRGMFSAGSQVTADVFAAGILRILNGSDVSFEDVSAAQVVALVAEVPKRIIRAQRGDVVSIRAKSGNYHLAVVVARNRFGTALGFLRGDFLFPRVGNAERCQARSRPVYTDDQLVANGTWTVIGHAEDLLALFPDDPEIYHAPDLLWPDDQIGEFGSAESSSGLRRIAKEEAEEVGLLNGTYRQVYLSGHLQQLLDDGI